jgi:hypothetical protein
MTDNTGAYGLLRHLGDSPSHLLRSYGAEEVAVVGDNWGEAAGTSWYLKVTPAVWDEIVLAGRFRYPLPLIGLYGLLYALMQDYMEAEGFSWTQCEPFGVALRLIHQVNRHQLPRRRNQLIASVDYVVTELRKKDPRFIGVASSSEYLDLLREMEAEFDPTQRIRRGDKRRLRAAAAREGNDMASILRVYHWWDRFMSTRWCQVTVLPSLDPSQLGDAELEMASIITRMGWRFVPPQGAVPEVAEIRRHLSGETGTSYKMFV